MLKILEHTENIKRRFAMKKKGTKNWFYNGFEVESAVADASLLPGDTVSILPNNNSDSFSHITGIFEGQRGNHYDPSSWLGVIVSKTDDPRYPRRCVPWGQISQVVIFDRSAIIATD